MRAHVPVFVVSHGERRGGAGGGLERFVPRDATHYFGLIASTTF